MAGSLPTLTVTTVKVSTTVPTVSVPKVTTPPIVSKPKPAPVAPTPPKVSTPAKVSTPSIQATPTTVTHVATTQQRLPSAPVSPTIASPTSPSSGGAASSASPVQTSGGPAAGNSSSTGAQSGANPRFRASRPWLAIHGRHAHRAVILTFRLASPSRVLFTATQVAPSCRLAGSFSVAGHAGLNRLAFRGRVNGHVLAPGTYKISARVPGKRTVLHVVLVIVDSGTPSPSVVAMARRSDVCRAAARGFAVSSAGTAANGSGTRGEAAPTTSGNSASRSNGPTSGTAGETFTLQSAAPFSADRISRNARNPLVIFTLAAAILLLGLAALPRNAIPDPRMTDVLVRHRLEVALAGAAALTAALVTLMVA